MVDSFYIVAFTHKTIPLNEVGKLHIEEDKQLDRLNYAKAFLNIEEIMLISTCNRVEFLFKYSGEVDQTFLSKFFRTLFPYWTEETLDWAMAKAQTFASWSAVKHIFQVTSSLDSLVIGEREIITQVRESFERSRDNQLSGDLIRVIIRKTIETAKQVFTDTEISNKPVSVVNLAYRKLKAAGKIDGARILIVGAGVTNSAMVNNLKKHTPASVTIINRTFSKAKQLADEINATALSLEDLSNYKKGFDVLISCTGSTEPVISSALYANLLQNESDKKYLVDMALPSDFEASIPANYPVEYIDIESLKEIAESNLEERKAALSDCEKIIDASLREFEQIVRVRQVELAMGKVPEIIKEIKNTAIQQVFARDLEKLDPSSRETLEKVLTYMEKKYISVPMKMAKEILVEGTR